MSRAGKKRTLPAPHSPKPYCHDSCVTEIDVSWVRERSDGEAGPLTLINPNNWLFVCHPYTLQFYPHAGNPAVTITGSYFVLVYCDHR